MMPRFNRAWQKCCRLLIALLRSCNEGPSGVCFATRCSYHKSGHMRLARNLHTRCMRSTYRVTGSQFWIPFGGPYLDQNPNLASRVNVSGHNFSAPLFIGPCSCRAVIIFSENQFRIRLRAHIWTINPIWASRII
jgi:hypothetical protein